MRKRPKRQKDPRKGQKEGKKEKNTQKKWPKGRVGAQDDRHKSKSKERTHSDGKEEIKHPKKKIGPLIHDSV